MASAEDAGSSWIWGASLTVLGSIFINFGTNLVKYQHNRSEIVEDRAGINPETGEQLNKDEPTSSKSISNILGISDQHYYPHDRFLAIANENSLRYTGIAFFVIGNLVNFYSLALANQTLLSALGSVQFVVNVVFGYFILHVAITNRILLGTLVIVIGNVIVIFGSSHSNSQSYNSEELFELYKSPIYIVYLLCCIGLCVFGHIWFLALERIHGQDAEEGEDDLESGELDIPKKSPESVNSSNVFLPSGNDAQTENSTSSAGALHEALVESPYMWLKVAPVIFAIVSASIGTQSLILAKSLSTLLNTTLSGDSQMGSPVIYIVFGCWLFAMWFWLSRMDEALQRFDGAYIIPVLQVFWLLGGVGGGGIYFKEFASFGVWNYVIFFFGLVVIMIGVSLLAPKVDLDEEEASGDIKLSRRRSMLNIASSHDRWTSMSIGSSMPFIMNEFDGSPQRASQSKQTRRNSQ